MTAFLKFSEDVGGCRVTYKCRPHAPRWIGHARGCPQFRGNTLAEARNRAHEYFRRAARRR